MFKTYEKRRTYFDNSDFDMSLEEMDGHLFVHLVFFHVSKTSINKARSVWEEVKNKCYWLGYEHINTYTTDMRIVKLFDGWEHIGEYKYEGKKYEVARWELN